MQESTNSTSLPVLSYKMIHNWSLPTSRRESNANGRMIFAAASFFINAPQNSGGRSEGFLNDRQGRRVDMIEKLGGEDGHTFYPSVLYLREGVRLERPRELNATVDSIVCNCTEPPTFEPSCTTRDGNGRSVTFRGSGFWQHKDGILTTLVLVGATDNVPERRPVAWIV